MFRGTNQGDETLLKNKANAINHIVHQTSGVVHFKNFFSHQNFQTLSQLHLRK